MTSQLHLHCPLFVRPSTYFSVSPSISYLYISKISFFCRLFLNTAVFNVLSFIFFKLPIPLFEISLQRLRHHEVAAGHLYSATVIVCWRLLVEGGDKSRDECTGPPDRETRFSRSEKSSLQDTTITGKNRSFPLTFTQQHWKAHVYSAIYALSCSRRGCNTSWNKHSLCIVVHCRWL